MLPYNIDLNGKTILVTGAAGFIGSNLVKRLLNDFEPIKVIGIDSMTDYYDVNLKYEDWQYALEKSNRADGLPIPLYKVYNIGNNQPENFWICISIKRTKSHLISY